MTNLRKALSLGWAAYQALRQGQNVILKVSQRGEHLKRVAFVHYEPGATRPKPFLCKLGIHR